jgi:hypothetical protein
MFGWAFVCSGEEKWIFVYGTDREQLKGGTNPNRTKEKVMSRANPAFASAENRSKTGREPFTNSSSTRSPHHYTYVGRKL